MQAVVTLRLCEVKTKSDRVNCGWQIRIFFIYLFAVTLCLHLVYF